MTTDPFDALLRPSSPRRPRMEFAVDLRRRIEEELGMTATDHLQDDQPTAEPYEIWPRMIHLRVNDANQAMSFFGRLFDWEGERFESDHTRYYILNTTARVVLTDEAAAPPVRLLLPVPDVSAAIERIEDGRGVVTESEITPDGGGFALGEDGQQIGIGVWKPNNRYADRTSSRVSTAEFDYFQVEVPDIQRAISFWARLAGWRFNQHQPGEWHHVVDEAGEVLASFEEGPDAEVRPYFTVDNIDTVAERLAQLGGTVVGDVDQVGPGRALTCHDDQGTEFRIVSF
jgi:predicted enzyme related to lactoylglutathione lyase